MPHRPPMRAALAALTVLALSPAAFGGPADSANSGTVSVLAGGEYLGLRDEFGPLAAFNRPIGLAIDTQGNLYVGDSSNAAVRFIDKSGNVRTLAGDAPGFADGRNDGARFRYPAGVAVGPQGQVYVADTGNHRIRQVTHHKFSHDGEVVTFAGSRQGDDDGRGTAAEFNAPKGVAVDAHGTVYVADSGNHLIRRISPQGVVTTLAGSSLGFADGAGATAKFAHPSGIAVDSRGVVYVADTNNHRIRKITPDGTVSTLAGTGLWGLADGPAARAQFAEPAGVAVDGAGNVYVADTGNNRIRLVTSAGQVSTLAGAKAEQSAPGRLRDFDKPIGIAVDSDGTVYVADSEHHAIRKIQ